MDIVTFYFLEVGAQKCEHDYLSSYFCQLERDAVGVWRQHI